MKFYTGVGSRQTPDNILLFMSRLAMKLQKSSMMLRSGGAAGADSAFARGAMGCCQRFRPEHVTPEALEMAATVHPAWEHCDEYAKLLHARNCFQVLGKDLSTPSQFLVCWTPDGCISEATRTIRTGGTATAIVLAERNGISVYNLQRTGHLDKFSNWLIWRTRLPPKDDHQ